MSMLIGYKSIISLRFISSRTKMTSYTYTRDSLGMTRYARVDGPSDLVFQTVTDFVIDQNERFRCTTSMNCL